MSLFRGEHRADHPTSNLNELLRRRSGTPYAGQSVTADTAKRHSAVFACVDLIGRLISTMPAHEYRKAGEVREELPDPVILTAPDGGEIPASAWKYSVLESLLLRGNAYGLILSRDNAGWPTRIRLLHPDSVRVRQAGPHGPLTFTVEHKPVERYMPLEAAGEGGNRGDLWHVPAYTVAGSPIGVSPITYAALTIGLGLAAQTFGAGFFDAGGHPSSILQADDANNAIGPEAAKLIKAEFMEATRGTREPVVLPYGLEYKSIQIAPDESQFLDSIKASVPDVCRFFGVPPEEVGSSSGNSQTYANVESRGLALLQKTVGPWMVRLEEALTAIRPRPRFVKLNPDSLLRLDTLSRYKAHDLALRSGWACVDEIRKLEDLEPLPDDAGQQFLWPPGRMQLDNVELEKGADAEGDQAPSTNGVTADA